MDIHTQEKNVLKDNLKILFRKKSIYLHVIFVTVEVIMLGKVGKFKLKIHTFQGLQTSLHK